MTSEDVLKLKDNLFGVADEIRTEWKELHDRLSVADQKKIDIEHFIELYKLSASQGFKAYKMLQEALLERREIKDRIDELRPLMDFLNKSFVFDNNRHNTITQSINNKINNKKSRQYTARVLTELFSEEIIL